MKRLSLFLLLAACAPAISRPAWAQDIFSEVRLGVLAHDIRALGGREHGADINAELLFRSPVSATEVSFAPGYLRWLLQPRPDIGGSLNTAGATSEFYVGLTWTALLATNLFRPGDGISLDFSFGPSFNNGYANSLVSDRKSLGSNVLFRESVEASYAITSRYSISLYFDHNSNADLAGRNESLNDVGLRFGIRF